MNKFNISHSRNYEQRAIVKNKSLTMNSQQLKLFCLNRTIETLMASLVAIAPLLSSFLCLGKVCAQAATSAPLPSLGLMARSLLIRNWM
jgi:hypothetical protein